MHRLLLLAIFRYRHLEVLRRRLGGYLEVCLYLLTRNRTSGSLARVCTASFRRSTRTLGHYRAPRRFRLQQQVTRAISGFIRGVLAL